MRRHTAPQRDVPDRLTVDPPAVPRTEHARHVRGRHRRQECARAEQPERVDPEVTAHPFRLG